ncbi:MAG: hypothetical protein ACI865_001657 [Flavobacteriaceae bacterium]
MRKKLSVLVIVVCISLTAAAQGITPKFSYNVELGLPVATANEPFDDIMQGLLSVSTYGQYSFPFHLNFGAGVHYSYFTVNQFSVPSPVFGGVHSGSAFAKVGYDQFHTDRFATDFGVKFGYTQNYFTTDVNKANGVNPIQVNSSFTEAIASFILLADERNAYRWIVGYGIQGFGFNPSHIGLASNEGYDPAGFNKVSQYFVIGFGYTYYFRNKATEGG